MKTPPKAGLTLIEVMLAMAILSLGLVVVVEGVGRCLAIARAARLYNQAHALLPRVELMNPLLNVELQPGVERGSFDGTFSDFSWEREISMIGEEEDDRLFEVRTRVSWSARGKKAYEEVVEYRYSPLDEETSTSPPTRSPTTRSDS